jgi:hypothetical protein
MPRDGRRLTRLAAELVAGGCPKLRFADRKHRQRIAIDIGIVGDPIEGDDGALPMITISKT